VKRFTSEEVQWSCKEALLCECPEAWKDRPCVFNSCPEASVQLVPATTEEWKQAVTEFSGLRLTYPSDKLPALSGLASRFQQRQKVNYLAGLWLNDQIIEQLTWCRDSNEIGLDDECDQAYRAPTFSWASINARVSWFITGKTEPHIDILDARSTLASENPFGDVRNGYLRVRGRVARLMLQQPPSREARPSLRFIDGEYLGLRLYLDKGTGRNYFSRVVIPPGSDIHLGRSLRWLAEATGHLPKSISALCLRICVHGAYQSDHFLVLINSSLVPGAYERIGQVWSGGVLMTSDERQQCRKLLDISESTPIDGLKIV
jgi:hypothetical protein